MLELRGATSVCCDKISRRALLRIGALGIGGFTLPDLLRQRARAGSAGGRAETAVILIWMGGGPSHIDMYDLKPSAPLEFRGDFKPIATSLPGVQIGEHLPLQARLIDKMALVRSVTHNDDGHGSASHTLMTGWRSPGNFGGNNLNPSLGSVVAKMRGPNAPGLPPYVVLPKEEGFGKGAYLGASTNPFSPGSDPNSSDYSVRHLQLPARVDGERLSDRRSLMADLDNLRRDLDTQDVARSLDSFYRDAFEMITSQKAISAFDLQKEDPRLRDRYGRHTWGQSTLLARRLVEAGVTFVTVYMNGWDTHSDNFNSLKKKLPVYDQALSALVEDVYDRGLADRVLVMALGEFGRTPRIDGNQAGRHHWPGAMSVVFAGGGLKMGQVIGSTDARAEYPTDRLLSPHDVLATMYHVAGIDPKHVFHDAARRPLAILPAGEPIAELVG